MSVTVNVEPMILQKLRKGEKLLIKVDTKGMSKEEAAKYILEVHEQMTVKFPNTDIIVHPAEISFWVMPEPLAEYPKSKMIMVADY